MPDKNAYNPDFRPGYWDADGVITSLVANIKGEERKRYVKALIEAGQLEGLFEDLLAESLSEEHRRAAGAVHPLFMGGEYLPDTLPGEVEIARVTLKSATQDVISIRARPHGRGIAYRVVDEYEEGRGSPLYCAPAFSNRPLTQSELIDLIGSVEGYGGAAGLTNGARDDYVECGCDPEELIGFIKVTSEYYPELEAYFDAEEEEWIERVLGAGEEDE